MVEQEEYVSGEQVADSQTPPNEPEEVLLMS